MRRFDRQQRVREQEAGMRSDDELVTRQPSARARLVLALAAWVVVASATIGSLLYTWLERFTH